MLLQSLCLAITLWLPGQQPLHLTGALKPQRYWIPPKPIPHPCWGVRAGPPAGRFATLNLHQHRWPLSQPKQDMRRKRNEKCYSGVKKYGKNRSPSEEGGWENAGGDKDHVVILWWIGEDTHGTTKGNIKPHFLISYFCSSAACRTNIFSGSQEYQMPLFYLPAATFLMLTPSVGAGSG